MGFIGSGRLGSALARLAIQAGHQVVLSNSRGPETLAHTVAELGPRASAATSREAAAAGDIVVITVPVKAFPDLPAAPLAGKTVIDTCNYGPERDGHIPELDVESLTSSELLLRYIPGGITSSSSTCSHSPVRRGRPTARTCRSPGTPRPQRPW